MIQTREASPDPIEFFKLLTLQRFKAKWYGFLFSPLVAIGMYFSGYDTTGDIVNFLLLFSLLHPAWVIGYYYVYATSKKNLATLQLRIYLFTNEVLQILVHDEVVGEIPLNKIQKVIDKAKYFAIYQINGDFVFIPKSAFKTDEDLKECKKILANHCSSYQI